MILILDFDGVFVPYSLFWETLTIYGEEKGIEINDTVINSIKQSIVKNQKELDITLNSLGINDLKYLYKLYHNKVVLNQGAEQFLEFCNFNSIRYVFFSSATPQRIINTFAKNNIQLNPQDIYFAESKDFQAVNELRFKLFSRFGDNNKLLYVDDYPRALIAGKKNGFFTIMKLDENLIFNDLAEEYHHYIDYEVKSFLDLEKVVKNVL